MDTLAPFRKIFRYAAVACTICSAILTAWFGIHQDNNFALALVIALFLVVFSVCSDYIWLFAQEAWRKRDWMTFSKIAAGGVFVGLLNITSNLGAVGYQTQSLSADIAQHNIKVADTRDSVSQMQDRIRAFQARQSTVATEKQALISQHGWASTATAHSARAVLADLEDKAAREAARVKCGPKCESIKDLVKSQRQKIGTLESKERIDKELAELDSKIAAANRGLAKAKAEAKTQTVQVDPAKAQAGFFAGWATVSLTPDETATEWTSRGIKGLLSVGLFVGPILFASLGFMGWQASSAGTPAAPVARETPSASAPTVTPLQPMQREIIMVNPNDDWADRLRTYLGSIETRLHTRAV